jgi:alkylation response protein AidB-like acyl-CoA dehydrogenase
MGKPLIEHQAVNFRLADMATGSRPRASSTCTRRGCATPARPVSRRSMAKLSLPRWPARLLDAIQIHGGYGYVADFRSSLWRDVRVTQIYEGASDIQRLVIEP